MPIIKIITNAKTDFHGFAFPVVDVCNIGTKYILARVMMMKIPRYQAKFGDQAGIIFPSRQGSCLDRANRAISNGTARLAEKITTTMMAPQVSSLAGNVSVVASWQHDLQL